MGGKKNNNKIMNQPQFSSKNINAKLMRDQYKIDSVANDKDISLFQEQILKFTDSLIASTSATSEEINVWEPKTLAPYEPIRDTKFIPGANTLQVSSQNYIWACQATKNIMSIWRWDKSAPILRFPLREQLSVFRISQASQENYTSNICVGGSKSGVLYVWKAIDGHLLGEVEAAHYMDIIDLDISRDNTDMIVTGGKDCKVKVWFLSTLIRNDPSEKQYFVEFTQHTQEVTQVRFSPSCSNRIYSASIDKQVKVYDISQKICIKTIQAHSQIHKILIDHTETNVYVACDNQNVYVYSLEVQSFTQTQQTGDTQVKGRQKKTLQHKKRVTAICLSVDGKYLISGDNTGLIYIWSTSLLNDPNASLANQMFGNHQQQTTSEIEQKVKTPPQSPQAVSLQTASLQTAVNDGLISTYELHKDKGAITNLIPLFRPITLFGLTANMKSFEVQDIKPLQKYKDLGDDDRIVSEPIDFGVCLTDPQQKNEESIAYINSKIEESELDNYLIQCSQNLLNFGAPPTDVKKLVIEENNDQNPEDEKIQPQKSTSANNMEVQSLREENRQLKRTLMDRFDTQYS